MSYQSVIVSSLRYYRIIELHIIHIETWWWSQYLLFMLFFIFLDSLRNIWSHKANSVRLLLIIRYDRVALSNLIINEGNTILMANFNHALLFSPRDFKFGVWWMLVIIDCLIHFYMHLFYLKLIYFNIFKLKPITSISIE